MPSPEHGGPVEPATEPVAAPVPEQTPIEAKPADPYGDELRELFPEAADLPVTRHELPELRAVHFVIHGNLGDGCSSNGRLDALGKSVGEFLRARHVDIPTDLLER